MKWIIWREEKMVRLLNNHSKHFWNFKCIYMWSLKKKKIRITSMTTNVEILSFDSWYNTLESLVENWDNLFAQIFFPSDMHFQIIWHWRNYEYHGFRRTKHIDRVIHQNKDKLVRRENCVSSNRKRSQKSSSSPFIWLFAAMPKVFWHWMNDMYHVHALTT